MCTGMIWWSFGDCYLTWWWIVCMRIGFHIVLGWSSWHTVAATGSPEPGPVLYHRRPCAKKFGGLTLYIICKIIRLLISPPPKIISTPPSCLFLGVWILFLGVWILFLWGKILEGGVDIVFGGWENKFPKIMISSRKTHWQLGLRRGYLTLFKEIHAFCGMKPVHQISLDFPL